MKNIFLLFLYSFCLSSFAEIAGADQAGSIAGNTDVIDRNDNSGQAANKGTAGRVMANITGAALTAKAIPLLASPWPPDVAAGVQLLTMAGMEFAQGGADDSANVAQWGQQGVLSFDENQPQNSIAGTGGSLNPVNGSDPTIPTTNPTNSTDPGNRVEEIVNTINTPAFQEAITSLGQDPNAFAQKLALGEIQNDTQTAQALGLSPSVSDVAASQDIKNQILADVFGRAPESQNTEKVENLESASRGLASTGTNGVGSPGNSDLENHKKSDFNLSSLFGSGKEEGSEKLKDSWKSGLLDAGIQRGSKYLNIFQKASMNYKKHNAKKSFSKAAKLKSRG